MKSNYPGILFIVAAPSGGGKTSLVKSLVEKIPRLSISISHTTRPKRAQEVEGMDYFFVDKSQFDAMIQKKAFIEYAQVFDYAYGTSYEQIESRLASGEDIVLDIDWQGAEQIKARFKNAVSIFIVPPSLQVLHERLTSRQRDPEEVIVARMKKAQSEISHYTDFDYLIVNDAFDMALSELSAIVVAERVKVSRQKVLQAQLLSNLLSIQ